MVCSKRNLQLDPWIFEIVRAGKQFAFHIQGENGIILNVFLILFFFLSFLSSLLPPQL